MPLHMPRLGLVCGRGSAWQVCLVTPVRRTWACLLPGAGLDFTCSCQGPTVQPLRTQKGSCFFWEP